MIRSLTLLLALSTLAQCISAQIKNENQQRNLRHGAGERQLALVRVLEEQSDNDDRIKSGDLSKLGTILGDLVIKAEGQTGGTSDRAFAMSVTEEKTSSESTFNPEKVLVQVTGTSGDALKETLKFNGLTVVNCYKLICSAYGNVIQILALSTYEVVKFIRPVEVIGNAGSVVSEGDLAMETKLSRATFKVNGTGVKIGIISDSFNCYLGMDDDIAKGDLPSDIEIVNDLEYPFECFTNPVIDEGRAMAQLIHDIAPGAKIAFHTGARGAPDFVAAVVELIQAKCDIIVDDLSYFDQPFWQDGFVAQFAEMASTRFNTAFFSAAGNQRGYAWESPSGFVDSGVIRDTDGAIFHQFGEDENGNPVVYQNVSFANTNKNYKIFFQWDEPHWSSNGYNGSKSDLDFYFVYNQKIVARSVDSNVGNDPYEKVTLNPTNFFFDVAEFVKVRMVIILKSGPPPTKMKVVAPEATLEMGDDSVPMIFGQHGARNVAAVGAVDWLNTPAFGISPPIIRPYSNNGPVQILFDVDGNRLAEPEIRKQPLFAGPDGTQTSFFGKYTPDGVYRFPGTSAAAPHLAAVAALILQVNRLLTPQEVYAAIGETSIDMEGQGYDYVSGYGFVDAVAALAAVDPGVCDGCT